MWQRPLARLTLATGSGLLAERLEGVLGSRVVHTPARDE